MTELKLTDWAADNSSYPGLDNTYVYLTFNNVKQLSFGQRITPNPHSGQSLVILNIMDNKVTCKIVTEDKKEYFNQKYLSEGTNFFTETASKSEYNEFLHS